MVEWKSEIQMCRINNKNHTIQTLRDRENEKVKMEISQLQHIKHKLMSRKKQLLEEIVQNDTATVTEKMDRETKKIYYKVLPLASEIHRQKIKSLELEEQIKFKNMTREADLMLSAIKGENRRKTGFLSKWFRELEEMIEAGSVIKNTKYESQILKFQIIKERLEFSLLHCGTCVMTRISVEKDEEINMDDFIPNSLDVFSDIFIPQLLEAVRNGLLENSSVSSIVEHISQYIGEETDQHVSDNCESSK